MRKQKIIKMTASPLDPSLGGSFQPPATHNGDISIVFRGKNMSIHGWDGSAWSTIYTRNGDDKQFTFSHTYENYYVKSLTGSDETFSASFFSAEKYERSTPLLAGIQRDTKLYDIEEVPVYTASDANKLLTIMSDGSLAWLLANESYIVEADEGDNVGTGGEETGTSHVSAHLEENGTLFGNAAIVDGILVSEASGDYTRLAMTDDYRSSVNQTISFWFKSTYNPSNGSWMRFVHSHIIGQGPNGFFVEMRSPTKIYFKGATQGLLADSDPTAEAPYALNDGEWHQITVSWQDSGSETLRMWVDGQPLTVLNETHVGSGSDNKSYVFIGARQFGSPMEMDKVGITEEFIDDAEALARYNSEAPAVSSTIIGNVLAHPDTTIVGNPVYENDVLTLDGSSYMIHGDISEFMYQDYMTTNLWFKNTGGSRKSKFWAFGMNRTAENKYAHVLQQNNDVDLRFVSAAGATIDPTHNSVDDGQWHMITAVWDNVNGFKRLYLDGVQLGSDITFAAKSDPFRNGDDAHGLIVGTGTGAGSVRAGEAYMGQFTKMEIENAIWDASQIASKFAEGSGVS